MRTSVDKIVRYKNIKKSYCHLSLKRQTTEIPRTTQPLTKRIGKYNVFLLFSTLIDSFDTRSAGKFGTLADS